MQPEFDRVGIELEKFYIENVSMPEELKKEIFEYSRLNKIDLNKLTQFKSAKAIEVAAANESGAAGAGMGMGMGFAMAQQMGQFMNPMQGQQQTPPVNTPPPIPVAVQYFYAANGQQAGPVGIDVLKNLFASRVVNKDSLIWKQGMTSWAALKEVEELKSFLGGNTPPPLPTT